MAYQESPEKPSRDAGSHGSGDESGANRPSSTRMASDATGINPEASGPIDPRMPNLPPA